MRRPALAMRLAERCRARDRGRALGRYWREYRGVSIRLGGLGLRADGVDESHDTGRGSDPRRRARVRIALALEHEGLIVNGIAARYRPGGASELHGLRAATRAQDPEALAEFGVLPAHDILLLPHRSALSTYGPLVVAPDTYFVLGDNRDDSADSRYIGLVPRRNIIGRATRILVSLDPDDYDLPRGGRLLKPLR